MKKLGKEKKKGVRRNKREAGRLSKKKTWWSQERKPGWSKRSARRRIDLERAKKKK